MKFNFIWLCKFKICLQKFLVFSTPVWFLNDWVQIGPIIITVSRQKYNVSPQKYIVTPEKTSYHVYEAGG